MWTKRKVLELLQAGRIRGFIIGPKRKRPADALRVVRGSKKRDQKGDAEKARLAWSLTLWARENGFLLEKEYKFLDNRDFRFDFAVPAIKVAIEYEGLM